MVTVSLVKMRVFCLWAQHLSKNHEADFHAVSLRPSLARLSVRRSLHPSALGGWTEEGATQLQTGWAMRCNYTAEEEKEEREESENELNSWIMLKGGEGGIHSRDFLQATPQDMFK